MVIAPVIEDGIVTVPQGSLLSGRIVSVHRLGFGLRHCTASIEMRFDTLQIAREQPVPISSRVLEVETAKERVNARGVIGGIHPAINLSSGFSIIISALLMQPAIAVPVLGVKFLLVRSPDPEIYFPAGTEAILQVIKPAALPALSAKLGYLPELSSEDDAKVRRFLKTVPNQQSESRLDEPADLANVLLLGTQDQIERAFHAAGWTGAQAHNAIALYRMFYCVVTRAGYSKAPMTHLKLNGVTQQAGYQKTLDTFAKRHHIRLWKQDNSDIWLSAATEDLSFTVNKLLVSHASDHNIDNERAKVVNDLALTGCVSSASILPREDLHIEPSGKQPIVTDGEIAVVRLNDCRDPQNIIPAERHAVTSHMAHVAAIILRDVMRSNPLALSLNTSNMILNKEDAQGKTQPPTSRQERKAWAENAANTRWKRQIVVPGPVAVANRSVATAAH